MDIKRFITYVEISSFLHDIGKLSHEFILSKDPYSPIKDSHASLILEEDFPKNLKSFLFTPLKEIFGDNPLISDGLSPIHFICAHHGCERCIYRDGCKTFDKNPLINLLKIGDRFDSSNPPNSGKQDFNNTFISDFFLNERRVNYKNLTYLRKKLLRFIDPFFKNLDRDRIIWTLKIFLSKGISDTRRGANDIDLFSHSYAVGSIVKSILFDYLYFGYPFPETIFDVELKFLKTKPYNKKRIEEEIGFGNEIVRVDETCFFLIGKGVDNLFLKMHGIEGEITEKVIIKNSEGVYPHPIDIEEILSTMLVKTPKDLGLSFEKMVDGVKEIINFGRYKELQRLKVKKRGIEKHIKNLKRGAKNDEIGLKRRELKLIRNRINYLKRVIKGKPDIKKIESFLSISLAPIRPPSINRFSSFLISLMEEKRMNIKELTVKFFLNKPLTISRIVRYGIDLKEIKSLNDIPKFYGKVRMGRRYVRGKYLVVKGVERHKKSVRLIFNDFYLDIPLLFNGNKIDELNLYFWMKGKRNGKLSFYTGKERSLVHITEIKKGDILKVIKP